MKTVKLLGTILTGIGAILIGIVGVIILGGFEVVECFIGISVLVLGIGLLLNSIPLLCCKKKKETTEDPSV